MMYDADRFVDERRTVEGKRPETLYSLFLYITTIERPMSNI